MKQRRRKPRVVYCIAVVVLLAVLSANFARFTTLENTKTQGNQAESNNNELLHRPVSSHPPQSTRPAVLVISSHSGTINDMKYISQQLNLNLTVSPPIKSLHPSTISTGWQKFSMSREQALEIWERKKEEYCTQYDYIVVIDPIPSSGRPIMQGLTTTSSVHCQRLKQVIILVSQRFDFMTHTDDYHAVVQQTLNMPIFKWIQNNPYEEYHMMKRGITLTTPLPIIRPHGVIPSDFSGFNIADDAVGDASKCAIMEFTEFKTIVSTLLIPTLDQLQLPFTQLYKGRYGGPSNLALFKCFIFFPYQVSVMAMYENLHAGVKYLVPSATLLQQWCNQSGTGHVPGLSVPPAETPPSCQDEDFPYHLVEFYNDYFGDLIVRFDNATHLRDLVLGQQIDWQGLGNRAVVFMKEHEKRVIDQWKEVFV